MPSPPVVQPSSGAAAEIDPDDVGTWPEYYYGERLALEFDAEDLGGVMVQVYRG